MIYHSGHGATASTPHVDSLPRQDLEALEAEAARLRKVEEELSRSKTQAGARAREERMKALTLIQGKVEEHEQADKSLASFQSKLMQSQPIVDELELTLKRLQNEAERANK